ncbi:hypothetical protein EVAR_86526_1 [Eumeta japonica]|uniref:Uncharacterized protein n=1 Tax=Eumeta variegata TaxID=151549 RepID=A0A4C1VPB1_EUMVA|nr:hypothetical protein EVAR_86526_1 [Eumeta japonica]
MCSVLIIYTLTDNPVAVPISMEARGPDVGQCRPRTSSDLTTTLLLTYYQKVAGRSISPYRMRRRSAHVSRHTPPPPLLPAPARNCGGGTYFDFRGVVNISSHLCSACVPRRARPVHLSPGLFSLARCSGSHSPSGGMIIMFFPPHVFLPLL